VSAGVQAVVGGNERVAYTIEHRGDCILIDGEVPMSAFGTLVMLAPNDSVMDPDAARMLGVTFAFGPADQMEALKATRADAETKHQGAMFPQLSPGAQRWLASGQRGMSSEALFTRLSGVNCTSGASDGVARVDHPYDPDDFRRCRLMLEACPELEANLNEAAGMSQQWAALIQVWGTLCDSMDWESPDWRNPKKGSRAPATYQLIKKAIGR
jgi:hypothetical protein